MYMVYLGEEGLGCTFFFFLGRLGVTTANSVGELWSMYCHTPVCHHGDDLS